MRMWRGTLAGLLVGTLAWPTLTLAVVVPVGTEFQVNTYTTDFQLRPSVCSAADGDFVVAWTSFNGQDGDFDGIFAQRYGSNGETLGTEFQVNTYTTGGQFEPAVCCDKEGNFVVTWTGDRQDGDESGIFGQRFASDGDALGTEFQVNTYTSDFQDSAAICCDAVGNFVVSWESYKQDSQDEGVFAQRFRSDGAFRGTEFQVNTYTSSEQDEPAVCCDANGNFVIVWESTRQDGSGDGVFGQRFAQSGAFRGTEFQVNTSTVDDQDYAAVCCDPVGNFVVAWESDEAGPSDDEDVFAQRFTSSGATRGTEFLVNSYTDDSQGYPALCCGKDGSFVITWDSGTTDEQGYDIRARRFAANGNPEGPDFQVSTYTSSEYPAIACDEKGDFVIVWESNTPDGSGEGVFGQRFTLRNPFATPVLSWLGLLAAAAGLVGLGTTSLRRKK